MARIMAIDYGDVRIGIALTDPMQIIASGYQTLKNNNTVLREIARIAKVKEVESVVMGIPFDQHSEIGPTAIKVLNFVKRLMEVFKEEGLQLPFYEQDERYTTMEAQTMMREFKVKRKKKRKIVDQIAASKILSSFMNNGKKTPLDVAAYLAKIPDNDKETGE